MTWRRQLLRAGVLTSCAALCACGVIVVRVQGDGGDGSSALRPLIYGIAVAFLLGSILCLVGLATEGRHRSFPVLVAGASLATFAVSVPSLLSAAYPFVLLVWGYVWWRWQQRQTTPGTGTARSRP